MAAVFRVRAAHRKSVDLVKDLVFTEAVEVSVHEAKTHLSRLLRRVLGGEEITISKGGKPVARLVPLAGRPRRRFGVDAGAFDVPEDFDAPLPAEVLDSFES